MAFTPCIRCILLSEFHTHSLKKFFFYSAPAPVNVVRCGISSYLLRSDSEDIYV